MAVKNNTNNQTGYSRFNEIIAVGLVALAVLIFLCLVTYNPNDWSLNTASSQRTQNWIGVAGSVIADLMFQAIGLTAYLLPAVLGVVAWRFFRAKETLTSISRIIGYVVFIVSLSSLIQLFGFRGGIIGAAITSLFTSFLGVIGSGILLTVLLITSILLITNLSFISFFSDFEMAWQNFQLRFGDWFGGYREWRENRRRAAFERMERRRHLREGLDPEKKEKRKTPTISAGDLIVSEPMEEKGRGRLSDLFARLTGSGSTAEPEAVEAEVAEVPAETTVEVVPTISASDEDSRPVSGESEPKPVDVPGTNGAIPITPVKETGDLTAEAVDEESEEVDSDEPQNFDDYVLPHPDLLKEAPPRIEQREEELLVAAKNLTEKTKEFNVTGQVKNIGLGPVVTTFEFKPDPGVKYSRVTGLAEDLCLALKAESIRIERIPGKAVVGIEVPNKERETIFLRDVIDSDKFRQSKSLLTIALGKRINGVRQIADLAKMPHLLIAGATGAGKSVGVNTLIVSILYKAKPDEVKFIMVDPKRLELGLYADIPHLATPIITDPKRAGYSLKWAVSEMERRYKHLAGWGVRNIDGYNTEVIRRNKAREFDEDGESWPKLPYIVIIIDELADLMMVSGKDVETSITRLAQMARAVGIHLVLATQRPSVDVITGLIKANFPARISFRVSSKIDSRTIMDSNGAEGLLGKGDMLFLPPATSQIIRVHGAYVDEREIQKIVKHIKDQGNPDYDETITKSDEESDDFGDLPGLQDVLFADALQCVVNAKRASTSLLQRHLRIGYGRAAAILDALVAEGYIGEMDGSKRARPILQKAYQALQEAEEGREL